MKLRIKYRNKRYNIFLCVIVPFCCVGVSKFLKSTLQEDQLRRESNTSCQAIPCTCCGSNSNSRVCEHMLFLIIAKQSVTRFQVGFF
jgi:hypothetical protein